MTTRNFSFRFVWLSNHNNSQYFNPVQAWKGSTISALKVVGLPVT